MIILTLVQFNTMIENANNGKLLAVAMLNRFMSGQVIVLR